MRLRPLARWLMGHWMQRRSCASLLDIAADICVHTNLNNTIET